MSCIILDRDGVINHDSSEYIKSPEEWLPIPGSLEAMAALNRAGFRVFIATNQSGIARGYYSVETLHAIHEKLTNMLATHGGKIEEIFFCPHHPDDHCPCRKPQPGLLLQIQKKYSLSLNETFFIGDSLVDIQAGQTAGCLPLLVRTGKGQQALKLYKELAAIPNFADLSEAVEYVCKEKK